MRILPSYSYEVMLRPISPSPPMGMTLRVPGARAGGSKTSELGKSLLASGARDLRECTAGGGIAVGAEVGEVDAGHVVDEGDLVFDERGFGFFGADERQADAG